MADTEFELTPEMKAKIDEIKKEHGVRELNPAELDGVAGGSGGYSWRDFTQEEMLEYLLFFDTDDMSLVFSVAEMFGFHPEVITWAMGDLTVVHMDHYRVIWNMVDRQYNKYN